MAAPQACESVTRWLRIATQPAGSSQKWPSVVKGEPEKGYQNKNLARTPKSRVLVVRAIRRLWWEMGGRKI